MSVQLLYVVTGFFVGLLVGQTGMGGGSLVTPILVLAFGVPPAAAVGTDLLYASITKAVGTAVHGANRTVQWPIVAPLAAGSVPATAVTLVAISYFDLNSRGAARAISTVLGVMLLITAVRAAVSPAAGGSGRRPARQHAGAADLDAAPS